MTGLTVRNRRARVRIKQVAIGAYCRGWTPAWAVSAAFRLLNLERL